MRLPALLLVLVALAATGSALAATGKPKLVRVVRHHGSLTATLTYKNWLHVTRPHRGIAYSEMRLSVRRAGRVVFEHRICPLDMGVKTCAWADYPWGLSKHAAVAAFRPVAGRAPAVEFDLYTGGAHCCSELFVAVLGHHARWIAHDFGNSEYRGKRIHGRFDFVSSDDRFAYVFSSYAGSFLPLQVWTIKTGKLADVTRTTSSLVRPDARSAWTSFLMSRHDRYDRGLGALAGWCADEYSLERGGHCQHVLQEELAAGYLTRVEKPSGERFVRALNRYLLKLGYKRR